MTDSTSIFGLTVPSADGSDDFSADLWRDLADDIEAKSPGVTPMTTAARTALSGGDKFAGRLVYDTTLNKVFVSDGTDWHEVTQEALPLAGGTMTGSLTLSGAPSSGLHAATKTYADTAKTYAYGHTSSQTVTPSTNQTIRYSSESDASGMLDITTGIFTIPTTGLWSVSAFLSANYLGNPTYAHLWVENTAATETLCSFYVSGITLFDSATVSAVRPLTAGATYRLRFNYGGTTSNTLNQATCTFALLGV